MNARPDYLARINPPKTSHQLLIESLAIGVANLRLQLEDLSERLIIVESLVKSLVPREHD